jgi:hypothetical protein
MPKRDVFGVRFAVLLNRGHKSEECIKIIRFPRSREGVHMVTHKMPLFTEEIYHSSKVCDPSS